MICSKKIPKKANIYAESEVEAKCEGIEGEVLKYILSLLLHNIFNNIYNRSCNAIYQKKNSS